MKRGLTLLECLLSLSLLSVIAGVLVSWLTIASQSTSLTVGAASWEDAASRTLALIHDDMVAFDAPQPENSRRSQEPRILTSVDELTIQTRTGGSSTAVRYTHAGNTLRRSTNHAAGSGGQILLDDVAAFSCELDDENEVLLIELSSSANQRSVRRWYRIP